MMKVNALAVLAAILIAGGAPVCIAEDSGTKPDVHQPIKKKTDRGWHRTAPDDASRSMGAPFPSPQSTPKGDGGKPDDTIGGLPGQKRDGDEKQP